MKRFRGQKRYYRNLARYAACFTPDLKWQDEYHMYHMHIDLECRGSISTKHRRSHFRALLQMLENTVKQLDESGRPYQCFLSICPNSWNDALYVHIANPEVPFPYLLNDADWDAPVPPFLQGLVDRDRYRVGSIMHEEGLFHKIVPRNHGIPLWH